MSTRTQAAALLPSSRQPRLQVLANGATLPNVLTAHVISNNHYAADRFTVTAALGNDIWLGSAPWAATDSMMLDIQMCLLSTSLPSPGAAYTSLVQGLVDIVEIDPLTGIVRLEGRDLTAAFIEARTQETFANRTSSEIATILAGRHGLSAQVTATTVPVGQYYELEHDQTTLNQFSRATTEWDLLVFLAGHEGFDVFVQGSTLFFQPPTTDSSGATLLRPRATLSGSPNVMDLKLERSLTLARDIAVTVKSWNSRQQNAFTQTARTRRGKSGPANADSGAVQTYVYVVPNLSMDQALKLAQRKLAELTLHERVIHATMPGELTMTPRDMVALEGTGTDFDQQYYIDQIERRFSLQEGFIQTLRAKNSTPGSQTTTPATAVGSVTG